MQSDLPYYLLIFVSMGMMFTHALKYNKQLINYLVAIFSASLCMVGVQKLSADSVGAYQYLIGLATCGTCNVVWLIARTLFREHSPISSRHIVLALFVAGLVIFNQTWHLIVAIDLQSTLTEAQMLRLKQGMNEITTLLSSCILGLSFWEAFRSFKKKNKTQKIQSTVFASAFFLGVFNSAVLPKFLFSQSEIHLYSPWILTSSALLVLLAIQFVVYSQQKADLMPASTLDCSSNTNEEESAKRLEETVDSEIISGIENLVKKQQIFLRENLKIANFAQALNTSEYKVSKAIRYHYKVANFNLFVNQHRVEFAKNLLLSDKSQHWSILVIAMESGFTSLGTFNRVFKAISGQMPNEYRKQSKFDELMVVG